MRLADTTRVAGGKPSWRLIAAPHRAVALTPLESREELTMSAICHEQRSTLPDCKIDKHLT